MRLIDANELLEHAYRDRLDSRERIADMINNAPTVKEIPVRVPLDLVIKALEGPKTGHWIAQDIYNCHTDFKCTECGYIHSFMHLYGKPTADYTYCPSCGAKMKMEHDSKDGK